MIFVSIPINYYGLILYLLRKTSFEMVQQEFVNPQIMENENEIENDTDNIIKWDRTMFVGYEIVFLLFSFFYFVVSYSM